MACHCNSAPIFGPTTSTPPIWNPPSSVSCFTAARTPAGTPGTASNSEESRTRPERGAWSRQATSASAAPASSWLLWPASRRAWLAISRWPSASELALLKSSLPAAMG